jgi:hypothetical protein
LDFGFWIEEGVQRFLEIAKSLISFYNSFGNAIDQLLVGFCYRSTQPTENGF